MLEQMTLPGIEVATFSPALADGLSRSEWQGGRTTDQSGRDHAPVSRSPLPEKATECPTSDTFGLPGTTSFESAALTLFLVNRLKRQSDMAGSTLFKMTWKQSVTPSRRSVYLLRASVRRISDSDCGSWPTPTKNSANGAGSSGRQGGLNLQTASDLASWPTPVSNDATGSTHCYSRGDKTKPVLKLPGVAQLASWPTPQAIDSNGKGREGRLKKDGNRDPNALGSYRMDLKDTALLAGWVTPSARDWKDTPGMATEAANGRTRLDQLPRQAAMTEPCRLTASGAMLTGLDAATGSGGQLNPALARWLMGYPPEWCDFAPTATR